MELGGLEPPTSWVRFGRSAAGDARKSGRFAGLSTRPATAEYTADSRRYSRIASRFRHSSRLVPETREGDGGSFRRRDPGNGGWISPSARSGDSPGRPPGTAAERSEASRRPASAPWRGSTGARLRGRCAPRASVPSGRRSNRGSRPLRSLVQAKPERVGSLHRG
jgi:hypothetical protein